MRHRLCVPASSANLGPGFDALGLALNLYLTCIVSPSERMTVTSSGIDADAIPQDESNLIWQTASGIAEAQKKTLPPIHLEIHNDIPIGKGLGSSAAALTAGVVLANLLLDLKWSRHRILDEATCIEGHPDNVSACVLGSIVASSMDAAGTHAVRVDLPANYAVAVVVPDFMLPTSHARSVCRNPIAARMLSSTCSALLFLSPRSSPAIPIHSLLRCRTVCISPIALR